MVYNLRYSMRFIVILMIGAISNVGQPVIAAYDILAVLPIPFFSHYAVYEPLLLKLAARGHRVTVYTPFIRKDQFLATYRQIDTSRCFKSNDNRFNIERANGHFTVLNILNLFVKNAPTNEQMAQCRPISHLYGTRIADGNFTFDLLISEAGFDIFASLAGKFRLPLLSVFSNELPLWLYSRIDIPNNANYLPALTKSSDQTTLYSRAYILLQNLVSSVVYDYQLLRPAEKYALLNPALLPPSTFPTLKSTIRNTSLLISNSHFTLNGVKKLNSRLIDVNGINVKDVDAIPPDIEKFINGSEHGVVYFCMGSLLRGSSFPEEKRNAFLYAFSKIPQRVLWKWEGDSLPGKPDNVMIAKWMPQRDILAHPNVKLFISHGGLLGTNEAVYEGVPILGIPIFGDQRTNVKSIEASGAGELLDYNDISGQVVLEKIQKLLSDPQYREKAKELSRRYRDRPMSPLDTAVYWTEYVIRHKGAHHLRSAAVDLPWYQYLLLDVIAFILLVLVATLLFVYYTIKFTLRFIFRKLFGGKQPTKKSEKSKKKLN